MKPALVELGSDVLMLILIVIPYIHTGVFFFSAALGSVDYSHLPESLRYIKRKQGALKWENPSLATSTLSKLFVNRNFWKNMIYQMPSVPMGKLGIVT